MGLQYKVRSSSTLERWYELRFEEVNGPEQTEIRGTFLPPEWFPQSGVQLTWPHAGTDWCYMLEEVTDCYVRMAYEIASREPLLIVTPERTKVETLLKEKLPAQVFAQIRWADCPTDDTWARDHGLWLDHGYLSGDDTDSHIDTLARFCPDQTIAYVKCEDRTDEHYEALARMEEQLRTFRTLQDEPYRLVALPMPEAIFDEDGQRLPATYANFLVVNGAVLMPTYHQPALDEQARKALQKAFPQHEVVGIDCRPLIRQHGSLHCCTMQFPVPVLK